MHTLLNARQQALIPIAAFTACGAMDKLDQALNAGLDAGLTINEIKDVLVQLYAYCGFPRSLNALGCFMSVVDARKRQGKVDDEGKSATLPPEGWNSLVAGTDNQTRLVGQPVSGPLFDFAPAIDVYLKAHLFGDIFQRDVLDWPTRELATIAALAAIQGAESQLKSHYTISRHNGITVEQLRTFIAVLAEKCLPAMAENARAVLEQFLNQQEQ
ncbi:MULTISPECIES: carboxymuconolactone decarboxylase family protein [Enterobacteriaceae]|uniref:carboxymuconolactone decarboxylase family protein n=1 Tax=Enterobacteriaceae TaxID=543 RepID=UPI0015DD32B9|nr:carboxymuconolactone decarboxylase family protein [Klebsiella sp. WP8-S18-ESBL-06]BBT70707.1 hypothetical protein WP8S18E06_20060 [Klebsiella sp. WP8-S18-ESBL-06]